MAPAFPGLKSSFQAGKRRKGKRQTTFFLFMCHRFILESITFLMDLCLYLIGQNSVTLLSVTAEKAGVQLLLSSAYDRGRQGKEIGMRDKGDTVSVTMTDQIFVLES